MDTITFGAAQKMGSSFSQLRVDGVKQSTQATGGNGDTVSLSDEAKALANGSAEALDAGGAAGALDTQAEKAKKAIEERIKQLQKEIKEIQESTVSEEEKARLIQSKQAEIMELMSQLRKAGGANSQTAGGTRAGAGTITGKGSL